MHIKDRTLFCVLSNLDVTCSPNDHFIVESTSSYVSMTRLSSLSYPLSALTTTNSRIVTGVNRVAYYRISLIFTNQIICFNIGSTYFLSFARYV